MNTQKRRENQKKLEKSEPDDRGVLVLPPEPPRAGTLRVVLPPGATWRGRKRGQVVELEIILVERGLA